MLPHDFLENRNLQNERSDHIRKKRPVQNDLVVLPFVRNEIFLFAVFLDFSYLQLYEVNLRLQK